MIRRWLARWLGPELSADIQRLRRELHIEQAGRAYAEEQWRHAERRRITAERLADEHVVRVGGVRDALETGEEPQTVLDRIAEAVRPRG